MRFVAAALFFVFNLVTGASAQQYPDRTVRIIVPYAPGGPNDAVARTVAQHLNTRWGQPVVVENRPGGGGSIGAQSVAKSPADGYALLFASSTFAAHPALFPNAPYNMQKDFATVVKVVDASMLISAHPSLPVSTIAELIDYARKNPGKVNYATVGATSTPHLGGEYFNLLTGANLVHVPFKGEAPATTALLGGSVQIAFTGLVAPIPHIRSGKLKAIAVTSAKRLEPLPDTPTVGETVPGFELSGWYSLLAPAGTPPAIINNIAANVREIMRLADVRKSMAAMGLAIALLGPEEFKTFLASEITRLTEIIIKAKIKVE